MARHVKERTYLTCFVESEEPLNFRVIAEAVAKNIIMEGLNNDTKRTI